MVHVHPKITVEGEFGVAQGLASLFGVGIPRRCADQDPGAFNLLRLVRVQNRHLVEGAIKGTGLLSRHQSHVSGRWQRLQQAEGSPQGSCYQQFDRPQRKSGNQGVGFECNGPYSKRV